MIKKIIKLVLVCMIIVGCVIAVIPYCVHSTSYIHGVVKDTTINEDLHEDLKNIASVLGGRYMLILVYDRVTNTNYTVISGMCNVKNGDLVSVDVISIWHVSWYSINFFNQSYDYLVVGNVKKLEHLDLFVEGILQSRFGEIVYIISMLLFFFGPICIGVYVYNNLKLTGVTLVISLYSLCFMIYNYFASVHDMYVQPIQKYFGYSSLILLPLTLYFARTESTRGLNKFKKMWKDLIDILADIFGEK